MEEKPNYLWRLSCMCEKVTITIQCHQQQRNSYFHLGVVGLAKLICGGATPITCNKASTVLHSLIGDFSSNMSGAAQTSTYVKKQSINLA